MLSLTNSQYSCVSEQQYDLAQYALTSCWCIVQYQWLVYGHVVETHRVLFYPVYTTLQNLHRSYKDHQIFLYLRVFLLSVQVAKYGVKCRLLRPLARKQKKTNITLSSYFVFGFFFALLPTIFIFCFKLVADREYRSN